MSSEGRIVYRGGPEAGSDLISCTIGLSERHPGGTTEEINSQPPTPNFQANRIPVLEGGDQRQGSADHDEPEHAFDQDGAKPVSRGERFAVAEPGAHARVAEDAHRPEALKAPHVAEVEIHEGIGARTAPSEKRIGGGVPAASALGVRN